MTRNGEDHLGHVELMQSGDVHTSVSVGIENARRSLAFADKTVLLPHNTNARIESSGSINSKEL